MVTRAKDNEVGKVYGKLTVIRELPPQKDNSGSSRRLLEVQCSCGNVAVKKLKYLKNGQTTTCGNCKLVVVGNSYTGQDILKVDMSASEALLIGSTYGRLTVVSAGYRLNNSGMLKVQCSCGNIFYANKKAVLNSHTTSCGCYVKNALGDKSRTHGKSATRVYQTWLNMKQRCVNPNNDSYENYGGRGIGVCTEWLDSFETFLSDMGDPTEGMTIERVDVNKGYSKENCIWADRTTQAFNTRLRKGNKTGKAGVQLNKKTGNYTVSINYKGQTIYLGTYSDLELACLVREEAELKYYGRIKSE